MSSRVTATVAGLPAEAAALARWRADCLSEEGFRRLPHWEEGNPIAKALWWGPWETPRWVDHAYRLRLDGVTTYVAEPYGISDDAIVDLRALVGMGFRVLVGAHAALHYPGQTVAIWITPPGGEPDDNTPPKE